MSFEAAEGVYEQLEARLMSHGVYVEELDPGDPLEITYETVLSAGGVPDQDIGRLCNVLLKLRADGWEPEDVHARAFDIDGEPLGTWHAEGDWFHALEADDITEVEFSERVLGTVELADD